jgi:outer membrane receptor protein involved in Fe transport
LAGAKSRALGGGGSLTIARPAADGVGGWRLQAWIRSSNLANTSVAVAADRRSTTPANEQYATPAVGYGLNAAVQGRAGGARWEAGFDARMAEGFDHERFRYLDGGYTRGRKAGGRTAVAGLYAEVAVNHDRWLFAGGVRADAWRASGAVRVETDLSTGIPTLDLRPRGAHGLTPTARIGARYQVNEGLWLRSAAYAGFRPPTLNELHRPFRVGNDITEANPALRPERLAGAETGVGGPAWSATLFYNRLEDPVANVTLAVGPATSPVTGVIPAGGVLRQRRNVGAITAWGLEGEAHGRLGEAWTWRAAGQLVRARVDGGASARQLTGKRPAQSPRTVLTAGVEWKPAKRIGLSAQLRYESARFEDDLNTRRLAAGADVDARATWRLGAGEEVYLAIDNVAGARLEVGETAQGVESYAQPRTLRAGFSLRR